MKTYQTIKTIFIIISSLVLAYFNITWALGWALGWAVLTILAIARKRFYEEVLNLSANPTGKVILYNVFVFAILWLPALFSFMFPQYVNPYALIATYALDRLEIYIKHLFFPSLA